MIKDKRYVMAKKEAIETTYKTLDFEEKMAVDDCVKQLSKTWGVRSAAMKSKSAYLEILGSLTMLLIERGEI